MLIAPDFFRHARSCTTFCLSLLLVACASSAGVQKNFSAAAKRYIQTGEWEKAYRTLEDALGSPESAIRLSAYDMIAANQELRMAAVHTFSVESLEKTFQAWDTLTAKDLENVRLIWFGKFASDEEIWQARNNLESVYANQYERKVALVESRRTGANSLIVDDAIFGQLVEADRLKFKAMYPSMQIIPFGSVGITRSSQIIDRSVAESSAGSRVGSAVAQAAYIDRSIGRYSYSALGQLSAGLLGGIIGSAYNTPAQNRFIINYGVELRDGTIRGVLKSSTDGIASPVGQCVYTTDMLIAPRYLCTDTIVGFIERAKRQNLTAGSAGATEDQEKVSCKVDKIGVIQLDTQACQKLGGRVTD